MDNFLAACFECSLPRHQTFFREQANSTLIFFEDRLRGKPFIDEHGHGLHKEKPQSARNPVKENMKVNDPISGVHKARNGPRAKR